MGGKFRILVADDEVGMQRMLERAIRWAGHEAVLTGNGKEAFETFAGQLGRVHAVVTDFGMPIMNGLELIEAIHLVAPNVPLVLMSGEVDEFTELSEEARKMGACAILAKPFGMKRFQNVLSEVLASYE